MKSNKVYFTALEVYGPQTEYGFSWKKYIEWSRLSHLIELVSLDGILNGLAFQPDFNSKEDWNYIVTDQNMVTVFFNSSEYVLDKVKSLKQFNYLAVVKEPNNVKAELTSKFEFVGYDLIEKDGDISALTNCGGFDETFLPYDLNEFGLISDYNLAKKIQSELVINNPDEHHANCYLYEVWRHKIIGRI